jgi:hypothetical protein
MAEVSSPNHRDHRGAYNNKMETNSMKIRALFFAFAFLVLSLPAFAQPGGQPGPPAGTGETIQSLSAKLAALTARVQKIESGAFTAADLVGSYAWAYMGIELVGSPGRISNESIKFVLTLTDNGNIEARGTADDCQLTQGIPWAVTCAPQEVATGQVIGTWRVQDGQLFITFEGDSEEPVAVGAGGRVIVHSGLSSTEYAPGLRNAFSNIGVLIKLPSQ